jgi:hypothetical protein
VVGSVHLDDGERPRSDVQLARVRECGFTEARCQTRKTSGDTRLAER